MKSLLSALRHETGPIHNELHGHPLLIACQEKRMDRKDYAHMLKAFYAPWKILIPAFDRIPIADLKPRMVQRAQALRSDLEHLDVDSDFFAMRTASPVGEGELLGMCYVVAGSSMGASQLKANALASIDNLPVSYLSISPRDAGWPLVANHLEQLDSSNHPDACDAAVRAFRLIQFELSLPVALPGA